RGPRASAGGVRARTVVRQRRVRWPGLERHGDHRERGPAARGLHVSRARRLRAHRVRELEPDPSSDVRRSRVKEEEAMRARGFVVAAGLTTVVAAAAPLRGGTRFQPRLDAGCKPQKAWTKVKVGQLERADGDVFQGKQPV